MTENRMLHCLAVAHKMRQLATIGLQKYGVTPEEAFLLGLLHDIGYEITQDASRHAPEGGLFLKTQGYNFWAEVYNHGDPDTSYKSPLLTLLNYVDMTTGPEGEDMTLEERVFDIGWRYGKGSPQEINAKKMALKLEVERI